MWRGWCLELADGRSRGPSRKVVDERNRRAVELLHRLRDLCEENSRMGVQINGWLEELRDA